MHFKSREAEPAISPMSDLPTPPMAQTAPNGGVPMPLWVWPSAVSPIARLFSPLAQRSGVGRSEYTSNPAREAEPAISIGYEHPDGPKELSSSRLGPAGLCLFAGKES